MYTLLARCHRLASLGATAIHLENLYTLTTMCVNNFQQAGDCPPKEQMYSRPVDMSFWYHARIRLSTCVDLNFYSQPAALYVFCVYIHDRCPDVPILSARRQALINNSIFSSQHSVPR